jgi:hypothetical protein
MTTAPDEAVSNKALLIVNASWHVPFRSRSRLGRVHPRWTAMGFVDWSLPSHGSLPRLSRGSASTWILSRFAQDSLALQPARLRSRLSRDLSPGLRHGRFPSRIAWVATKVNRKLLGRIFHPLVL